jgi:hypothetical protein
MFDELKKTFAPPYNIKDLYSIFISLFIMLAIPLTVLQITSIRDNRSSASTQNPSDFKVVVNSLTQNGVVSGSTTIEVEASDTNNTVTTVSLIVDEETVATNNNQSRSNKMITTFTWDTTKIQNGNHEVQAVATNSLGKKQASITYKLAVANNDSQKPTVGFIGPSDGDYITGDTYKIRLSAEDDFNLANVTLSIDGKQVINFTSVPFEYDWSLTGVSAGSHTLSAVATDNAGNSSSVTISIYKAAKAVSD